MEKELILLDDLAPDEGDIIEGVRVITAKNCEQALDLLKERSDRIRWVVVDLGVPQGGWQRSRYLKEPGLALLRQLKAEYGSELDVAATSFLLDESRCAALRTMEIPDDRVFSKRSFAFREMVRVLSGGVREVQADAEEAEEND